MAHLRLYNVGDIVDVAPSPRSSGGVGWITAVDETTGWAMVKYVVQKKVSKDVVPQRISPSTAMAPVARKRATDTEDSVPLPSILSQNYSSARDFRNLMSSKQSNQLFLRLRI